MEKSVIIIGGGLGGLQCGYILSKEGYQVTILEKENHIGGSLEIGSGFNYVGALGPGQPLNKLFKYFNLLNLPWYQLDPRGFNEVIYEGKSYMFANGPTIGKRNPSFDQFYYFAEVFSEKFPNYHSKIKCYASFLSEVAKKTMETDSIPSYEYSAYQYLNNLFAGDQKIINVLSSTSLNMSLDKDTLPLYPFAQINSSQIQSSWRLRGSVSQITDSLADSIINMGGNILTECEVTRLYESNGSIVGVQVKGGDRLQADYIISDTNPAITLSLLPDSSVIKNIYRKKLLSHQHSREMFSVNVKLKNGEVKYLNRNVFINEGDVWSHIDGIMVSFRVPEDGGLYSDSIDIITPIDRNAFVSRRNTSPRNQEELNALKHAKAQECVRRVCHYFPGLNKSILSYSISNSISTSNSNDIIAPKTPVSNLFFTGQNPNLHDVLGVSMTSYLTCSEVFKTRRISK